MNDLTYNDLHFQKDVNDRISKKLNFIIECGKDILSFIKEFLLSANGHEQLKHHESFLYLIIKIRFNIESSLVLSELLKEDYRYKTSVNILFRSLIDDVINLLYLLGFAVPNSIEQEALRNELNILDKEFLASSEQIINSEFENFNPFGFFEDEDLGKSLGELRKSNSHLYDFELKKWKKKSEIRKGNHEYFNRFKLDNSSRFISEAQKIEFIKLNNFEGYHTLSYLNKYFTQYFHFSPKMHDFLLDDIDYDLQNYLMTFLEILTAIGIANKVISLNDNKRIENEINRLILSFQKK